jgi:hypothetical protein
MKIQFQIACGFCFIAFINFSQSSHVCPLKLQTYTDIACVESSATSSHDFIHISGSCQFIFDGLYRTSCENDVLYLDPCFESSALIQPKTYALNTCFANSNPHDNTKGPYSILHGSCADVSTCHATNNPAVSIIPTISPTPIERMQIADMVNLPSPPLPANAFADQLLDVSLAHEIVYLAGRLIYQMLDEEMAKSLLPPDYTFHFWADTGSTEVLIVTTKHKIITGKKGKIFVLFRGTDNTPDGDWLRNINLPKVPYGPDNAILDGRVEAQDIFGHKKTYEVSRLSLQINIYLRRRIIGSIETQNNSLF